eukprot:SAG22_NODE_1713_length_3750_cov_1.552177_2_plen_112_part_00
MPRVRLDTSSPGPYERVRTFGCASKSSKHGMETTDATMPCSASALALSTAISSSEPVAAMISWALATLFCVAGVGQTRAADDRISRENAFGNASSRKHKAAQRQAQQQQEQ